MKTDPSQAVGASKPDPPGSGTRPAYGNGQQQHPPPFNLRDLQEKEEEEKRWRKREAEICEKFVELLAAQSSARGTAPPRQSGDRDRGAAVTDTARGPAGVARWDGPMMTSSYRRDSTAGKEGEPPGDTSMVQNPVVRRYYQSPFVNAAAEFAEREKQAEERRLAARARTKEKRRARRRGYQVDSSSSEGEEEDLGIPTTVRFRDRIKTFQKFNKPDGTQTWLDFLQQIVEILSSYRVPAREWAAWLVDRLTGKAQAALLNMAAPQRCDWATVVSALNSYFNVEFEMRAAEEDLLARKQGPKESVRDFISQLKFLARKAYGQDLERREAAVLKRLELGLGSASLRHAFDDMMLQPGMTLSVVTAELVRRESRDDPARYQQFLTQEKETENAQKPNNLSQADRIREIAREVLLAQKTAAEGSETVNVAAESKGASAPRGGPARRGRGRGRGSGGRSDQQRTNRDGEGRDVCWNCDQTGHFRTDCPRATNEEKDEWRWQAERARKTRERRKFAGRGGRGSGKAGEAEAPPPQAGPPEN